MTIYDQISSSQTKMHCHIDNVDKRNCRIELFVLISNCYEDSFFEFYHQFGSLTAEQILLSLTLCALYFSRFGRIYFGVKILQYKHTQHNTNWFVVVRLYIEQIRNMYDRQPNRTKTIRHYTSEKRKKEIKNNVHDIAQNVLSLVLYHCTNNSFYLIFFCRIFNEINNKTHHRYRNWTRHQDNGNYRRDK